MKNISYSDSRKISIPRIFPSKSYLFCLTFVLVSSLCVAQVELEGKMAKQYDYAKDFSLQSMDGNITIQQTRLNESSRKDSISFTEGKKSTYALLLKNKLLLNEKGDSLAFYKKRKVYFPNSKSVVDVVKLKRNFLVKEGWAYIMKKDTIAKLTYKVIDNRLYYQLTADYENNNKYAILALQIGIGRIDTHTNMDYDSNDWFVTTAGVLGAILAMSLF